MKKISFLGTLAASILLAGCGGGGGGGSNNNGGGGTTPVSTPFRSLTPATYVYNLSGTLTRPGTGTQALTASSQRSLVVTAETTASQFKIDGTDALVVADGSPSTALNFDAYVSQQSNKTLLVRKVDVGDGIQTLNATRIFLPGIFTTNTSTAPQTFAFSGGGGASYTFEVGGIQSVTVPLGTYDAYVVTSSLTIAANNKRTGTYYYVPVLGTYVKSVETITRPDGTVASVTAELRSQS